MVHFTLVSSYIPNKDVYVMGDFTRWQKLPQYKMNYNSGRGEYILDLLVKQGFYDYMYNVTSGGLDNDFVNFENTFFDTENTYFIYLYYMRPGEINYRLIGYRQVSSISSQNTRY